MLARTDDGRVVELLEDRTWQLHSASQVGAEFAVAFRKVPWGANRTAVVESERTPPTDESTQTISFADLIAGLPCTVLYIFVTDRLVRAKYVVTAGHVNSTKYLSDFETLQALLVKKYGPPAKNDTFWAGDLYKHDPSEWGMAVSTGDLSKYCTWDVTGATVVLALSGDNYEVLLQVEYSSVELQGLEEAAEEASALEAL